MTKKRTKASLRKEADRVFSIWIRLRDRDASGQTCCFTCAWKGDMKKAQNGHFVPRQYLSVRYDEVNCHAQCYACNMLYNGQPSAYAKRLRSQYDDDIVELLEGRRREITHDFDYRFIIDVYTEKLNRMGMGYLL